MMIVPRMPETAVGVRSSRLERRASVLMTARVLPRKRSKKLFFPSTFWYWVILRYVFSASQRVFPSLKVTSTFVFAFVRRMSPALTGSVTLMGMAFAPVRVMSASPSRWLIRPIGAARTRAGIRTRTATSTPSCEILRIICYPLDAERFLMLFP